MLFKCGSKVKGQIRIEINKPKTKKMLELMIFMTIVYLLNILRNQAQSEAI